MIPYDILILNIFHLFRVSIHFKQSMLYSETLDGDQSVYERIVDQLEDLQRFHQELIRIAESGVHEDLKTFESKQKGILTMSTQKGPKATPQ